MDGHFLFVTLVLLFCVRLTCVTLTYTEQCKYWDTPSFLDGRTSEQVSSYVKDVILMPTTAGKDACTVNLTQIYWDMLAYMGYTNVFNVTLKLHFICSLPQKIHFETYNNLNLDTGNLTSTEIMFALDFTNCIVLMDELQEFSVYGRISKIATKLGSIIVSSNCSIAEHLEIITLYMTSIWESAKVSVNSPQNSDSIFWDECAEFFSTLQTLNIHGYQNDYSIDGTQLDKKFPNLKFLHLSAIRIHAPVSYSWNNDFYNIDKVATNAGLKFDAYDKYIKWAEPYVLELRNIPDFSYKMVNLHGLAGKIFITGTNVRSIPELFFHNVIGPTVLDLSQNLLNKLPSNLFQNMIYLENLYLNGNRLYILETDLFVDLKSLKLLDLSNNRISEVDTRLFSSLTKLSDLHLEYNHLSILSDDFLKEQLTSHSLKRLYLFANPLGYIPIYPLYSETVKLIDMHECFINSTSFNILLDQAIYSNYDYVNNHLETSTQAKSKKLVDFSNCQIENIVLTKSLIIPNTIFELPTLMSALFHNVVVKGVGNPIQCNCLNIDVFNAFLMASQDQYDDYWTCMYPSDFKGRSINDLTFEELYCPLENLTDCPEQCECYSRPSNNETIIVDCRNKNYTDLPATLQGGQLELWFHNCSITSLSQRHYFPNVSVLDLSDNKISNIRPDQLLKLSHLENLLLHNNYLTAVPIQIKSLNVSNLTLSQNPFSCDCHFTWMKKWLQLKKCPVSDWQSVKCTYGSNRAQQLISVHDSMFVCKDEELSWSVVEHVLFPSIIISSVLFVFVSLCLLIYFQRYNVKVLLYMYFGIHPFDKVKDTDESFKFDAYVIYAKQDSDFVENRLIKMLRERGFKVADFHTDLILGLTYLENAKRIVLKSKRMIFFFTENITNDDLVLSVWKYTYDLAMCDRLSCIILMSSKGFRKQCTEDSILQYIRKGKYIKDTSNLLANSVLYSMPEQYNNDITELDVMINDEIVNKRVTYIAYDRDIEEIENRIVPELRQFVLENDKSNEIIIFQNAVVPGGDYRMEIDNLLDAACHFIFILTQNFDPRDENARANFDDSELMLFLREAKLKSLNSCYNYLLLFTFGDIVLEELPNDLIKYTRKHVTYPIDRYRECLLEAINYQLHNTAQNQNQTDENETHADVELL